MTHGFIKMAAAVPALRVADPMYNIQQIQAQVDEALDQDVALIAFPELTVTGYTCADLFMQHQLLSEAEKALLWFLDQNEENDTVVVLGMPVKHKGLLFNCAVVTQNSQILGIVPKTYLPNYHEFYEQRWFSSAHTLNGSEENDAITLCGQTDIPFGSNLLFDFDYAHFAIELCEDLWAPIPPSSYHAINGAEVIINLSATNEVISKHQYLRSLIAQQSARTISAYIYASAGFGESTQDLVYAGNALIYENGTLLAANDRFTMQPQLVISEVDVESLQHERMSNTTFQQTVDFIGCHEQPKSVFVLYAEVDEIKKLTRRIDPHPFVPSGPELQQRCEEIINIQTLGLAKRVLHTHAKSLVIGVSGGLDSTLALLVAANTLDRLQRPRTDILAVTMPGFGTTKRTHSNADTLMERLGVTAMEIPIGPAVEQHFKDIKHDPKVQDVTYENCQARERTQILFDLANQHGGLVVGTGDLSELALGWATYNGDHISSYGVNASIPKTLVRHLIAQFAQTTDDAELKKALEDILDTPVSPELLPADAQGNIAQQTEDIVGPYELHDFFLYHFMRHGSSPKKILFLAQQAFSGTYDDKTIRHWLRTFIRRFFSQQFKRSCLPDGPKVGSVTLSPRGDWRMPSDASSEAWLKEIDE